MSLFSSVARFASSPQGRRALRTAKGALQDPKNRAKVDELVHKVKDRGRADEAASDAQRPASVSAPPPPPPRTDPSAG